MNMVRVFEEEIIYLLFCSIAHCDSNCHLYCQQINMFSLDMQKKKCIDVKKQMSPENLTF